MSEVRSPLVRGGVLEPGGRWRNWGRSESAHPQYVATVASVDEVSGGDQAVVVTTVEREGGEKPVCVAELVIRRLR